VLGAGGRETKVGHSLGGVEGAGTSRLVAVQRQPALPAGAGCLRQPRLDRLGEPVADPHDAGERRCVIGGVDLDEPQGRLGRWRVVDVAAKGHPAPARLQPARAQPLRQLRGSSAWRERHVEGDATTDRGERLVDIHLCRGPSDPETDDAVEHRRVRRLRHAQHNRAAGLARRREQL
jgi:hypothetical protein